MELLFSGWGLGTGKVKRFFDTSWDWILDAVDTILGLSLVQNSFGTFGIGYITDARFCRYRGIVTTTHDYVCVECEQACVRVPRRTAVTAKSWLTPRRAGFPHASAVNGGHWVAERGSRLTVLPPVNSEKQPAADKSGAKDVVACELRCPSATAMPVSFASSKSALGPPQPQRVFNNAHASHSALCLPRAVVNRNTNLDRERARSKRSRNPQVHPGISSSRSWTDTYPYYLRACMHKPHD